jgi:hypothetical protein
MIKKHLYLLYWAIILLILILGIFICQIKLGSVVGWKLAVEIISDVITAMSALVVAGAAIPGFNAWRKQMQGKTEYELARRYLRAIYKVRNSIREARNPFIPYGEMVSSLKERGFDKEDVNDNMKMNEAVYSKRWERVGNAILDLSVESLEAEVIWGKKYLDPEKELRKCAIDLKINIERFLDKRNLHKDQWEKIDNVIYEKNDEDDFNKKLNTAIEPIEKDMRIHIKK